MDEVPRNQTPLSDTALAMIARNFEVQLVELEEASRAWAARPHSPEARFISTMIGTMRGFGKLALAIAGDAKSLIDGMERVADTRLKISDNDVEKMRISLSDSAAVLDKARAGLANVDMAREHLAKKVAIDMSTDILAAMKPHMGAAIIIKQRQQHWRAYGFAGLAALGFVVVGIVFGVWASAGPSLAQESINLCASAPYFSPDGNAWCNLRHLPHISPPAPDTNQASGIGPATLK